MTSELRWRDEPFAALTPAELYAILALRQRVFIVEQHCPYLDADGFDAASRHVWAESRDQLAAYLRIVPPGVKYPERSIGRVITAPEARGTGLGRVLMQRGIELAGPGPIRIGAQAHLQRFYGALGFAVAGDIYDEDGIPHVEMVRP